MADRPHAVRRRVGAVVLVGVGAMWVRSYWRSDVVALFLPGGEGQAVISYRGRVAVAVSDVSFGAERGLTLRHDSDTPAAVEDVAYEWLDLADVKAQALGFAVAAARQSGTASVPAGPSFWWAGVQCPYAAIAGVGIVPVARAWRHRRQRRLGLCPVCGYDLRESPARCPECGTERGKPET